jgi:NitT/TauT family transport system permease protein
MLSAYFAQHWWATFWVSAVASALAVSVALTAAILSLSSKRLGLALSVLAAASQSFPLQAIAPLILITFGTGDLVKVGICFFVAFFPIFGNLHGAVANSNQVVRPFFILTGSRSHWLRFLTLIRESAPSLLAACKVGFTLAVLGAVVAEFILPTRGLGYVIVLNLSQMRTDYVLTAVGLLIAQGLIVFLILSYFESKALKRRGVI